MVDFKIYATEMKREDVDKLKLVKNGQLGFLGRVYRLNKDECLKVFRNPIEEFDVPGYLELTKCDIPSAVLPKKLITIDDEFYGYVMDYVDGITLEDIKNMDYSYLLKAFSLFLKNVISETAECGILVQDTHSQNIMYDRKNHKFKSIDCDRWYRTYMDKEKTIKYNFREIIAGFVYALKLGAYPTADMNTDFIDYYETIRENLEKKTKEKIKTAEEMRVHLLLDRIGWY